MDEATPPPLLRICAKIRVAKWKAGLPTTANLWDGPTLSPSDVRHAVSELQQLLHARQLQMSMESAEAAFVRQLTMHTAPKVDTLISGQNALHGMLQSVQNRLNSLESFSEGVKASVAVLPDHSRAPLQQPKPPTIAQNTIAQQKVMLIDVSSGLAEVNHAGGAQLDVTIAHDAVEDPSSSSVRSSGTLIIEDYTHAMAMETQTPMQTAGMVSPGDVGFSNYNEEEERRGEPCLADIDGSESSLLMRNSVHSEKSLSRHNERRMESEIEPIITPFHHSPRASITELEHIAQEVLCAQLWLPKMPARQAEETFEFAQPNVPHETCAPSAKPPSQTQEISTDKTEPSAEAIPSHQRCTDAILTPDQPLHVEVEHSLAPDPLPLLPGCQGGAAMVPRAFEIIGEGSQKVALALSPPEQSEPSAGNEATHAMALQRELEQCASPIGTYSHAARLLAPSQKARKTKTSAIVAAAPENQSTILSFSNTAHPAPSPMERIGTNSKMAQKVALQFGKPAVSRPCGGSNSQSQSPKGGYPLRSLYPGKYSVTSSIPTVEMIRQRGTCSKAPARSTHLRAALDIQVSKAVSKQAAVTRSTSKRYIPRFVPPPPKPQHSEAAVKEMSSGALLDFASSQTKRLTRGAAISGVLRQRASQLARSGIDPYAISAIDLSSLQEVDVDGEEGFGDERSGVDNPFLQMALAADGNESGEDPFVQPLKCSVLDGSYQSQAGDDFDESLFTAPFESGDTPLEIFQLPTAANFEAPPSAKELFQRQLSQSAPGGDCWSPVQPLPDLHF